MHVDDTVPVQLAPSENVGVGITVKNTGENVWNAESHFYLVVMEDPEEIFVEPYIQVAPEIVPLLKVTPGGRVQLAVTYR